MDAATDARTGDGRVPAGEGGATWGTSPAMAAFTVDSRHAESDTITSLVLRPADGSAPFPHRAGQHLTLFADIPAFGRQKRNYTISSAPNGETYRISVKREPAGRVSRWLHEAAVPGTSIDVLPPSGSFVLPEDAGRPIVMVSAGVGLTPMVAMLEAVAAEGRRRPIHFVHCSRNRRTQAFHAHVQALARALGTVEATFFHTQPDDTEVEGVDFDRRGRLTLEWLAAHTPLAQAEYFVCGPLEFMRVFVPGLLARGVAPERMHHEFFGAVEDLTGEDPMSDGPTAAGAAPPADVAPQNARAAPAPTGHCVDRATVGEALLDSLADAVIVSDAPGDIVLWNPGAERIFGFAESEALGQSLDIIIPEPFRARHWEGYRETVASGQSRYGAGDLLAVPGLHKDGRRLSIEFTIVLLKDADGIVTGMAASVRDVSARFEETKALKKRIAALEAATGTSKEAGSGT